MPAPEIKFCGLTRPEDAGLVAQLGAEYAGVIFAGGRRHLEPARAREVLAGLGSSPVQRVGVFGAQETQEIVDIADEVALHVVQLHVGVTRDRILSLRERFAGSIWVVVGVSGGTVPSLSDAVIDAADAIVLDTSLAGRIGGTGATFDWAAVAPWVAGLRSRRTVVLAGGLRAINVGEAVRTLAPQVVDVSSGVESAPGIKDHELMRAFAESARRREER